MRQALALAALADGSTSPNPRVGCVLVRDGEAVGRGFHGVAGGPHAEVHAVREAGESAGGATLYVNLEPCDHHGKTPPCTELLAQSGVRRVVAAMQDPNPLVNGRGFEALRREGLEVRVGLLRDEAERLNDAFLGSVRGGRPRVTLKAAISLDGQIAAAEGNSQWITGAPARRFAHRLRWRHDAVLVGAGTLRRDDPRLTIRLPGLSCVKQRVVLSDSLDLDPGAVLFEPGAQGAPRPRVYTGLDNPEREAALEGRAAVVRVGRRDGELDLAAVLADLRECGVQSILVEGGAATHAAFVRQGLADRAALFVSTRLLGSRGGTPLLDLDAVAAPDLGWRLTPDWQLPLGDDLLLMGPVVRPGQGG